MQIEVRPKGEKVSPRSTLARAVAALAMVIGVAGIGPVEAADIDVTTLVGRRTWFGEGAGPVWNLTNNWSPADPPDTTGESALFNDDGDSNNNGDPKTTILVPGSNALLDMVFDSGTCAAYTFDGGTLSFGATGGGTTSDLAVNSSVTTVQTINSTLAMAQAGTSNAYYFHNENPGTELLVINGNVQGTALAAMVRRLTLGGAGDGRITGVVMETGLATVEVIKADAGTWTLTNIANTYTGATTINGGTLSVAALANGGLPSAIGMSSNAAGNLVFGGGTLRYTGANGSTDRNFTLNSGGGTLEIANAATDVRINGGATGVGGLTKTGLGTLSLAGLNTHAGPTTVSQGTVFLIHSSNNNIANSSVIDVESGATLNVVRLNAGRLDLAAGQTLMGGGTLVGDLTVTNSSTIAPGDSPGTLTEIGSQIWNGGGSYAWEIDAASTTFGSGKGVDAGYDWLNISGLLTLNATALSPFTITLAGLDHLTHDPGVVSGFDPSEDYGWIIATAGVGIVGFDPAAFLIDPTTFTSNNPIGLGNFQVLQGGGPNPGTANDLILTYRAADTIPEPATLTLLCVAGLTLTRRRR